MAVEYANPFKVYFACTTGVSGAYTSEATAASYNVLRSALLGHSYFFTGGTMTDAVQESYIRTTLNRSDIDWLEEDAAPILINIESADGITSWEPFQPHITTDADAYTANGKMSTVLDVVREVFPERRVGMYGWTPDNDWYAINEWLEVQANSGHAEYASRLSWYLRWKRENERVKRGGVTNALTNRGPLTKTDFLMPWLYLPNDTDMTTGTDWFDNDDGTDWGTFFYHCTAEAKRLFQKPVLPMIQFHVPETTTYIKANWTTHQLDVALNDPNCDGVVIYNPSGASWTDWRETVRDWVTANLV